MQNEKSGSGVSKVLKVGKVSKDASVGLSLFSECGCFTDVILALEI